MGKCVRIRGTSKPPPPPAAAEAAAVSSCLTLRSGRRVLPVAACSLRTSGRPRRHHSGSSPRWCSAAAEAAHKHQHQRACGGRPRRGGAPGRVLLVGAQQLYHDGRPPAEDEVSVSPAADTAAAAAVARGVDGRGEGDSFERPKTPLIMMTDDCDAAVAKAKAKHENESRRIGIVAGHQPPSPQPTEPEIEAFFAAAELDERRRFAEAYNYDVALDRPLEGRFEWAPVST